MSTYSKCPPEVRELAEKVLEQFPSYQPLLEAKVKIDFLFAYAEVGDDGESKGHALTKYGVRCLGITRKIGLKDRVAGRGDAEILLDGDWWKDETDARRKALLDHEMYHLEVRTDQDGVVLRDDLKRPKLKLRKHDVDVGWFAEVAGRQGSSSIEIEQAKWVMDSYGQLFWPAIDLPEPNLQITDGGPERLITPKGPKKAGKGKK